MANTSSLTQIAVIFVFIGVALALGTQLWMILAHRDKAVGLDSVETAQESKSRSASFR